MSALRLALAHPMNQHHGPWVLASWLRHQVVKRLDPSGATQVAVGGALLIGPRSHSVICLSKYVRGGLFDLEAFLAYAALLGQGAHFLDVGANIGAHSVIAARVVGPQGKVVAVEPDVASLRWLEQNLDRAPATGHVEGRAIADRERHLAFVGQGDTMHHLAGNGGQSIETTTVDDLVQSHALEPSRLVVKIDVEGWEPAVLLGARHTLAAGVMGLWVEANGLQDRCDIAWKDAVAVVRAAGYSFWSLDVQSRRLRAAPDPSPVSPSGDYLVTTPPGIVLVARALERWEEVARSVLGSKPVT